jgi:uncharacterized protein YkwD
VTSEPREVAFAKADSPPPIAALSTPTHPLTTGDAEKYVLALINRDRAEKGLSQVRWDETAFRAARRHAHDLAANGITSHVGTDGSVPEQRYTEAGGMAMVMENAGCINDHERRPVESAPALPPERVAAIEKGFLDEVPPHDGHRRNILTAMHVAVGVGVAKPTGVDVACVVEEFVDDYGEYEALPTKASAKQAVRVAGKIRVPATIAGVGVSRIDLPKPRQAAELGPRGYAIPAPYVTYWPPGFVTPKEVTIDAEKRTFSITVPLDDRGRRGLYGVSVWAMLPGVATPTMVSLRTIEVR